MSFEYPKRSSYLKKEVTYGRLLNAIAHHFQKINSNKKLIYCQLLLQLTLNVHAAANQSSIF